MIKNIFYSLLMKGGNLLIPLFTYPYLVRVLGPDGYGTIGYGIALFQYLNQMSDYSLPLTSTKELIKADSTSDKSKVFTTSIAVKFINLLVFSFLFFSLIDKSLAHVGLIFICASFFQALTCTWYFQSKEDLKLISLVSLIPRIIQALFIFLFIKEAQDVIILSYSYLAASIFSGSVCAWIILKKDHIVLSKISIHDIIRTYKSGINTFIGLSSIMLYTLCTPIIITYLSGTKSAGLYLSIDKMKVAAVGIIVIAGQAIYPRICKVLRHNKKEAISLFYKVLLIQSSIGLAISIFLFLFSSEIVHIVLGEKYTSMIELFSVLVWTIFFISCSFACNTYLVLPLGKESTYRNIPLLSGVIHVVNLFFLLPIYGLSAAIYSVFFIELFSMIFSIIYSIKLSKRLI